jgi:hypothetical protein
MDQRTHWRRAVDDAGPIAIAELEAWLLAEGSEALGRGDTVFSALAGARMDLFLENALALSIAAWAQSEDARRLVRGAGLTRFPLAGIIAKLAAIVDDQKLTALLSSARGDRGERLRPCGVVALISVQRAIGTFIEAVVRGERPSRTSALLLSRASNLADREIARILNHGCAATRLGSGESATALRPPTARSPHDRTNSTVSHHPAASVSQ